MSEGGFFDFSNPDFGAADPYGTPNPQWGLADPYSVPLTDYGSSTGSGWDDFLKAIPLIGQTFASTFNAVNNPSAPTAYPGPAPTGSENAPASAMPSIFDHLLDFHSPYPYLIGGAVLLLFMMNKQSGD